MSGALPNNGFEAINIKSTQRTQFSRTASGKTFRRRIDGQRWSFTCSYPNIGRSDFAAVQAFLIKQRSRLEDFTVTFPSFLEHRVKPVLNGTRISLVGWMVGPKF